MAQSEPMDSLSNPEIPLYDYLYRDSNRIASYAAQLFGGLLQSQEETDSENDGLDKRTQVGSMQVALHEQKTTKGNSTGWKRTSVAHDTVTSDVLSTLLGSGRVAKDAATAPHGSLIMVSGTLVFIDKSISELGATVFNSVIGGSIDPALLGMSDTDNSMLHFLRDFLSGVAFPSAFMLQSQKAKFVGTLKDSGMEEPIPSYYFKHGSAGLSDVYLVGIKEEPNPTVTMPANPMIEAGQGVAQSLSEMLFPPDAKRVTPIALFRKL